VPQPGCVIEGGSHDARAVRTKPRRNKRAIVLQRSQQPLASSDVPNLGSVIRSRDDFRSIRIENGGLNPGGVLERTRKRPPGLKVPDLRGVLIRNNDDLLPV